MSENRLTSLFSEAVQRATDELQCKILGIARPLTGDDAGVSPREGAPAVGGGGLKHRANPDVRALLFVRTSANDN